MWMTKRQSTVVKLRGTVHWGAHKTTEDCIFSYKLSGLSLFVVFQCSATSLVTFASTSSLRTMLSLPAGAQQTMSIEKGSINFADAVRN